MVSEAKSLSELLGGYKAEEKKPETKMKKASRKAIKEKKQEEGKKKLTKIAKKLIGEKKKPQYKILSELLGAIKVEKGTKRKFPAYGVGTSKKAAPKKNKKKTVSKWVHHVRGQSKVLGITYKQAMMDPQVRESYYSAHNIKGKKPF